MRDRKEYVRKKIRSNKIFLLLVILGVLKPYYNGDTYSYIVRYWNPLAYLWIIYGSFMLVLIEGVSNFKYNKKEIGLGVSTYFKENPDQLEYISLLELLKG